jgi:hypothetical protein
MTRPWYRKKRFIIPVVILGFTVLAEAIERATTPGQLPDRRGPATPGEAAGPGGGGDGESNSACLGL